MLAQVYNFRDGENPSITPFDLSPNSLRIGNGINTAYQLGVILKDLGFSREGATIAEAKPILGAFNFIQSTDPLVEKMLVTCNDAGATKTKLFYKTDLGAWTEIAAAAVAWNTFINMKVEMASMLGYCFFVGHNGTDFLPVGSLTNATFSTADNVTSMPQAKFVTVYGSQLYVAYVKYGGTTYPYRVVGSGVPVAGALVWSPNDNFFDVDFSDSITGMTSNFDKLIVFTKKRTYFYDRTSEHQVFFIGSQNNKVIQNHSVYTIFANTSGIWVTSGGQPQNIAGPIIDFIRNSDPTVWKSVLIDEEYYFYFGNVEVDGISYENCWRVYNFQTNNWRGGRELSRDMASLAAYDSPTRGIRLFMGDQVGNVWNKSKYSDATQIYEDEQTGGVGTGLPISAYFELPPFNLGDYSTSKNVDNLFAYAERAQGLKLKIRVVDKNTRALTDFLPLGELRRYANPFQIQVPKGAFLQVAGSENSRSPYFSFYGFDFDIIKEGNTIKPQH